MVDIYNYFKNRPGFNKLFGEEYLIIEYKCPLNVENYQFWTDSNLITFVVNGRKDWISSGDIFHIETGDALFIKKGVYTTRQYLDVEYCVMLFVMSDDFIRNFILGNSNLELRQHQEPHSSREVFPIEVTETFRSLVYSIFNYFRSGDEIPRELVEIKFRELLFNIVLNPKNSGLINHFISLKDQARSNLEEIMLKNYQYDLKLEDFARLTGRSLSSFKRDFKEHFGISPGKWILNQRLNRSKSLLLGTDLNINEVGFESGFRNNSHFSQVFKKRFNATPGDFRLAQNQH
ncbi:helix-turn-helix domain-containing protein [Gramella aestuarii]|uniref:Helix-turn-helix domain-containing protein n=1 Tax=Christiangramia aestuarii TaxID=1028746 RepID=A0A7K1LQ50_9FLAO|nr:helix-turn-helix domain-containing protein [Christiangramia aestuarii]